MKFQKNLNNKNKNNQNRNINNNKNSSIFVQMNLFTNKK